jgi:thiol-disulfide isomerase/thioredoxin
LSATVLTEWLFWENLPVMGLLTPNNFAQYQAKNVPIVWVFQSDYGETLKDVALAMKGKFVFGVAFASSWPALSAKLGLAGEHGIVISHLESQNNYPMQGDGISPTALKEHLADFTAGALDPFLRSAAPVPGEIVPGQVKAITADEFTSVVHDPSNLVMVMFTAPWCGECVKAEGAYAKLAEELKGKDNIALVTLDVSVNDVPFVVDTPLPTMILYAGSDETGVMFTGDKDMTSLKFFIEGKESEFAAQNTHFEL